MIPLRNKNKYVLVVSYYKGGIAVVDFTDPSNTEEVAYYVIDPSEVSQDTWSSYWYNGRIYANNYEAGAQSRGIDVFQLKHPLRKRAIDLPYLNPQTQLPYKIPKRKR